MLIAWLSPPSKVWVFVGVDGVGVRGRFIPYAAIEGVREEWRYRAAGSEGHSAWLEADIWTIYLAKTLASPSTRAAAAVTLAAAGDEAAARKLRIAAAEMANPRLRIALEKVADEAKDAAVVEALEAP